MYKYILLLIYIINVNRDNLLRIINILISSILYCKRFKISSIPSTYYKVEGSLFYINLHGYTIF